MLKTNLVKKSNLSLIKQKLIFSKNRLLNIIFSQQIKYQQIEEILNLLNSPNLQNEDPNKVKEILESPLLASEEELKKYLTNYPYRYIDITKPLSRADSKLLEELGINLEYLKMNTELIDETGVIEKRELSEYEINYINNSKKHDHSSDFVQKIQRDVINGTYKHVEFNKSNFEQAGVFAICPFTGKSIKSEDSFPLNFCILYRFISNQVFYLLNLNTHPKTKHFIYIPESELIIKIETCPQTFHKHIINFKLYCLEFRQSVLKYIINSEKRKIKVFIGSDPNGSQIGHYLINGLSAIDNLRHTIINSEECQIIITKPLFFGKIEEMVPELRTKDIEIIEKVHDPKKTFLKIINDNAFLVIARQFHYVTENLALRIQSNSRKKCSEDFLHHLEEVRKQHFPLMMIQLRSGRRKWLSQIEGVINIINALGDAYPNLGVVFDGFSRIPFEEDDEKLLEAIRKEKEIVQRIRESITVNVPIYDMCGSIIYESIMWASIIDFYFGSGGSSGSAKTVWIANKPGVAHEPAMHNLPGEERNYWGEWLSALWRENGKIPLCVPKEFITDYPKNSKDWMITDYDFDWRIAYKEIIRLISLLPEREINQ